VPRAWPGCAPSLPEGHASAYSARVSRWALVSPQGGSAEFDLVRRQEGPPLDVRRITEAAISGPPPRAAGATRTSLGCCSCDIRAIELNDDLEPW
jgi:hypothetical protein